MPKSRSIGLGYLGGLVALAALCMGRATLLSAQDSGSPPAASISRRPPIRHSSGTKLTEQQERGAGLFIQRCALCHLAKSFGAAGSKYCCVSSLGPSLSGMFKNMDPEQEQAMREIILNGGPTYMPGWKYGLEPKEIDDIIAYLKTLG